jgi:hypothetical protein
LPKRFPLGFRQLLDGLLHDLLAVSISVYPARQLAEKNPHKKDI